MMPSHPLPICTYIILLLLSAGTNRAAEPEKLFEKDILPLFQAKCLRCHGGASQKAGLDLRSKAGMLKGGETGPVLAPGSAERSSLWVKIAADKMPPGKDKLTEAEKVLVRAWIDSGARDNGTATALASERDREVTEADRQFWAFRKPVRRALPAVRQIQRVRNPVDAFIVAGLEKNGLTLSPEADRLTLLRRAHLDLTGLPPSSREIDAFLADTAPDAYERLIDRLLASPHYGERWGRHWLDLAGYADSEGILDADYVRTAAWRYRDYVIQAFNQDKPYDRFLREQIAGDELVDYWTAYWTQPALSPQVVEALVATGFLRCASDTSRPDFVNIKNAPGYYYQTLDDTVRIVTSAALGLTVQCAKCHSHKYDPIPQRDYYRVQAVFMSGYRPTQWVPQVKRRLLEATQAQEQARNAQVDATLAPLRQQAADLARMFGDRLFADRLAKLPEQIRTDVQTAVQTEPAKRTEVQKYLAEKFHKELRPEPAVLAKTLLETYPDYKAKSQALEASLKVEEAKRTAFAEIRAFYDLPGEAKTPLLRRGDYLNPGPGVPPGALAVLSSGQAFEWAPPAPDAPTSGRRLAFANWLTQPDHPLTARVLVNRLWLHHFGEGIVRTPDNFGHTGAAPTHPELLDWLATEFMARGWSIKAMHRLLLTSSTYRQASTNHAASRQLDPDNHLLWRQRLRRLEAETLRDAILTVAGKVNGHMFGPPVPMVRQGDGEVVTPKDANGQRRSIYLQVRRSQPLTLLQVFDQPVMETNCTRRGVSTVASQALTLLNSDFLTQQAEAFAARLLQEAPTDLAGQAMRWAFTRLPTDAEREKLNAFLEAQTQRHLAALTNGLQPPAMDVQMQARQRALADLCHMLLSANEFAYVD